MHTLESVLENETHKFLCDFEKETDHRIPARQPEKKKRKKKENFPNCGLSCSGWLQSKIERKWKDG